MITLLATVLAPPAVAQEAPRVDPDYLAYLDALDRLDLLPYDRNPSPEIGDGIVMLKSPTGVDIGRVLAAGTMPVMQERWFLSAPFDPGAAFSLEYLQPYAPGEEEQHLAAWNTQWFAAPCIDMTIEYKELPDESLTIPLTFPDVDRYHFLLVQQDQYGNDKFVGRMLREHHHGMGLPSRYLEHWAFFDTFDMVADSGDQVEARLAPTQFDTTAAFFASIDLEAPYWWRFVSVKYNFQGQGPDCLP